MSDCESYVERKKERKKNKGDKEKRKKEKEERKIFFCYFESQIESSKMLIVLLINQESWGSFFR